MGDVSVFISFTSSFSDADSGAPQPASAIGRDATQEFLNEAISQQRLPVKAHFNLLAWGEPKDVKNKISSALAQ